MTSAPAASTAPNDPYQGVPPKWKLDRFLSQLPIQPQLREQVRQVVEHSRWPTKTDPKRGGLVYTCDSLTVARLGELNAVSRRTSQRLNRTLRSVGLLRHDRLPMTDGHDPYRITVNAQLIEQLATNEVWRWQTSAHPAVVALRTWRPSDAREAQGPVMEERASFSWNQAQVASDDRTVDDECWEAILELVPRDLLQRTSGEARRGANLRRVLKLTDSAWREQLELVVAALQASDADPSLWRTGNRLIGRASGRRNLWSMRVWRSILGEARDVVEKAAAAEALRAETPVFFRFDGPRDLADLLGRLELGEGWRVQTGESLGSFAMHDTLIAPSNGAAHDLVSSADLNQWKVIVMGPAPPD